MDAVALQFHPVRMGKSSEKRANFIREWRKFRGLTLEQLAERAGSTHATLSRMERNLLPYSQSILETLAEELGCRPADLIMRDPNADESILSIWDQIPASDRPTAVQVLKAFKK